MFHVGQKVVCVNASGCAGYGIVEGGQYTVAGILDHPLLFGATTAVKLQGVGRPSSTYPGVFLLQAFIATRFRPLTDTSISDVLAEAAPRDSHKWDNRRKQKERV